MIVPVKKFFFAIYFLFFVTSVALIVIGSLLTWSPSLLTSQALSGFIDDQETVDKITQTLASDVDSLYDYGLTIFIIGLLTLVVLLIGLIAVATQHKLIVILYAVLIVLLMVTLLVTCCLFALDIDNVRTQVSNGLTKKAETYNVDESKLVMDTLHQELECCGGTKSEEYTKKSRKIPDSCCKDDSCKGGRANEQNSYTATGCIEPYWPHYSYQFNVFAYLVVAFTVVFGIATILQIALIVVVWRNQEQKVINA